jgi:glycosyltransferase involved in cell wall biosynthesis
MQMGGAERVVSTMANYWAQCGHVVSIITLGGGNDFYPLSSNIIRIDLGKARPSAHPVQALFGNLSRVSALRDAIMKLQPDAIISFTTRINVITLLAARGLHIPVLVSERCDPSQLKLPWVWKKLRKHFYPHAQHVVIQSRQALQNSGRMLGDSRFTVIANPVTEEDTSSAEKAAPDLRASTGFPLNCHILMGLGRFEAQKGFDLLIRAFARLSVSHPDWRLLLVGDGSQASELKKLVELLQLQERVYMPGSARRPRDWLRLADLFVFSSRFEGFPNALLEAMASGLPVISFDCPSGPGEIIEHGRNGMLVKTIDENALAECMALLMADAQLRHRLAHQARDVLQRYSVSRIMGHWESLLTGNPD